MRRLSIKLRITLWFTAFIVGLAAAALAGLLALGERTAVKHLRVELVDAASDSFNELSFEDGDLTLDDDLDYFNDGVYLLIFDEAGHPLFGRLPKGLPARLPLTDGGFQTSDGDGARWHVYDVLHTVEGYGRVWVRSVVSAAGAENAFHTLARQTLILLPLLALAAAVGGYMLIHRGFRPVRQITQTAEQIGGGEDLTLRISLPEGQDEIHTLAAAFDRMFSRLESAFEREKRFTSDASHELRTPAAVILAQCEVSLESPELPAEAREAFKSIQRQGRHMSALASQLLTLARADKAHLHPVSEPVNLSELAELVRDELTEAAEAKGISIHLELTPGVIIAGDETMLMRLWLNLMENGIKYGAVNGSLWVRLRCENGRAICEVADDGPGIPPQSLPKIWERFYRVQQGSQQGFGLGLSLVKCIAETHGGGVSAASVLGSGSVFSFWLPVKK